MSHKIITFTLELLGNIEMLEEQAPKTATNQKYFAIMKESILDFFREKARPKKATFAELDNLLEVVLKLAQSHFSGEDLKKIIDIIYKHQDLIKLQAKIKTPSVEVQLSKAKQLWRKVRGFIGTGLVVKDLAEKEKAVKAKNLPLDSVVPIPPTTKVINLYALVDVANRLHPQYGMAAQWLISHLKVFSFKQLCQSMKKACEELAPYLHNMKGYHLLTVQNKSQEWMANIAWRYLPQSKLPESVYSLLSWTGEELPEIFEKSPYKHFVLFDDALYSGAQLDGLFQKVFETMMFDYKKSFSEPVYLTVVIGFMSKIGRERVQSNLESLKEYNIHVNIITKELFNDIKSDWIEDKVSEVLKNNILEMIGSGEHTIHKTSAVTEWKKPDCWSTPYIISTGHIDLPRVYTPHRLGTLAELEEARKPFDKQAPIFDIKTPYRLGE